MSQSLKPGWKWVRLGDVATEYSVRVNDPGESEYDRFVGSNHIGRFDLTVRDWGSTDEVTSAMKAFKPGDYLFVRRSLYASDFRERAARADFAGLCSGDILTIRERSGVIADGFLAAVLNHPRIWEYVVAHATGSITRRIKWKQLAQYEFPLPPLAEQRRLAEVLWAVEGVNQDYLKTFEKAERVLLSRIDTFLSSYPVKKFSQPVRKLLREDPRNGFSPKTNDSGKGLRTVSISAISEGKFKPEGNIKYANVEEEKVSQFFVQENDLFVVRGNGNRNLAAKCGLAKESFDDLFYPDLLIRLRFDEKEILPDFAMYQWNSPAIHRNLILRAKSTNGIWKINGQDIRKHKLIVPSIEDQSKLLAQLESVEAAKKRIQKRLLHLERIKGTILNSLDCAGEESK